MDSQSNQHYFAQQAHSYPQSSGSQQSMAASVFQSSSSLASLASINTSPDQTNMNSRHSPSLSSAAPVSSPSNQQQFFTLPASFNQDNSHCFQQMPQFPSQQQQQHRGSFSEGHGSGSADTASFLQDFNLIAEAAKRAQMAVMMRDFDDLEM